MEETNTKKGRRLEDLIDDVLDSMYPAGKTKDYQRYKNTKDKPDFEIDGISTGIESKNWNPEKKNDINKHVLKTKILSRFKGRKWGKKVLVIPKLKFYKRDEKECRTLLEDFITIELDHFVTEANKEEIRDKLLDKLSSYLL
jgi:hypothetical protein